MAEASLRDTIKAAMADGGEGGDEGTAPAGEGAQDSAAPAAEGAQAQAAADKPGEAGEPSGEGDKPSQRRALNGKFAKADDAGHGEGSEAVQTADLEPPPVVGTIPVPAGLAAPLKAKWGDLPDDWRQAFVKQEDSFKVVRNEWQPKAERLNRLDEVIAPRRDKLTLAGVDEATWISRLAAAEDVLERNPAEGLVYLARSYGVDARQLVSFLSGPQAAQAPQMPPELQALYGEVQSLRQHVTRQSEQEASSSRAAALSEIQRFAADPANLYFENVKDDVAALLAAERATDLQDAYQKAIWANPEIRALLLQQEQAEAAKKAKGAQPAQRAAAASRAAVSVTGAPGPGASGAPGANPGNLRETIRAAMQDQAGVV